MIFVPVPDPPDDLQSKLAALQAGIAGEYSERVRLAGEKWKAHGSSGPLTSVRELYAGVCSERCMYCCDSESNQLDHFRPKAHYPDFVFKWANFVHSCGICNLNKQHRFAVLSASSGRRIDVVRKRNEVPVEPEDGTPLLIDPVREDPLQFLSLDILGTWEFQPKYPIGTREHERARYTIEEVLDLNRGALRRARKDSYLAFRRTLMEQAQSNTPDRDEVLQVPRHRAVWHEMKRQRDKIPELKRLFDAVPQAKSW